MFKHFLVLVVLFVGGFSSPIKREEAPPCQLCHETDPNKINVHLIPHSHDDVGWKKTVDQYFYGSRSDIHKAGVRYIISSTVEALKNDPARRFVQVETAFFWKWWQQQSDIIKQDFIDLVNNGQIEIINAAWSMNDEAATNYQSTIDQFTYGLRTINDTVGKCGTPRIGWQIDPFGHSREQASIFSQLGFDGVFFARIDYNDRNKRKADKNLEVVWQSSANLANSNIFTSIFVDHYHAPSGYCFDIECGDEVLNDDVKSPDYNIPKKIDDFQKKMESTAQYYQTNHLLVTMGGDFQYQSAEKNFINMDKLIAAFKNNDKVNLLYSTPSCYIKAVNDEATAKNLEFTLKTDDFFPYGSDSHTYWTGYFTSRPNSKRLERVANNVLQASKQLTAFSKVNGNDYEQDLTVLKQALGIIQHHDAITGTAKEAVANDYVRLLAKGIQNAESSLGVIITNLLKKEPSTDINLNLEHCILSNVSICEVTKSDRFVVTVYNPLERPLTHYVRLPVPDGSFKITGPDGEVATELLDSISSFSYIDKNTGVPSPKELVFPASDVPGLGVKLYYVEKTASKSRLMKQKPQVKFGTDTTGFEIDEKTGLLKTVTMNGLTLEITQQFFYYKGFNGDNKGDENRASGAYIFRPKENEATVVSDSVTVTSISGSLVDEVRQQVNDWVTQIIRVYKGANNNYIEFDWLIGPIEVDKDNGIGREIISRFTIKNFDNSETFFTDSNGRELIKRQLNKRSDYEYDPTLEPVSSNYYPVTSKIVIRDEAKKLEVAVLNDRAQGGSSLKNGTIELMLHRRLLKDDAKGVEEPLDDEEFGQGVVARGQLYLIIGSTDSNVENKSTVAQERELALKKLLSPLVLVGDATSDDLSLDKVQGVLNFIFEGLKKTLPENVHILTLEPWKDNSFVLRLEHILENNEDVNLSQSVTVNLENLFATFNLTEIKETTLGANEWMEDFEAREKYVWKTKSKKADVMTKNSYVPLKSGEFEITLNPMQIRTFIIKASKTI
ncbi:lysosomal alpha-mannosidase [Tribolium castaneum]|uniref:Alpha-mannosidase n=1 Tax=Tribolium castaneum TaxID=7070 RepID=D6WWY9_TRICA|nr:PREDICTED: lysosomal alpha-mannosidase [Tribolium castaneum]EFA08767.1 Alpha-mannosidase 2-like Protein [Tribolium castaneum]|eukprot:XP_008197048.1 PREDICTED: lysosomal alpha-mannosidase [Tribolium castaneum]